MTCKDCIYYMHKVASGWEDDPTLPCYFMYSYCGKFGIIAPDWKEICYYFKKKQISDKNVFENLEKSND